MPYDLNGSLAQLNKDLKSGRCSARQLVDAALARIAAVDDSTCPVFLTQYADSARAQADRVDAARDSGQSMPPYAGIPFAVKDLFDIQGETTTAGSIVLRGSPPARQHAAVVQRLIDAGMILIGKTHMTEFAFSGLGLNPHYGTPPAWGASEGNTYAPGGSSSGAALSIAARMVPVSLGTDTAGSCRIPAAWNGVVGYKPTQSRIPSEGTFPLSPLFDTPGPLAGSVACCHSCYQLMAGEVPTKLPAVPLSSMRFAVPTGLAMSALDPLIEATFMRTIRLLQAAGATIENIEVPEFDTADEVFRSAPMAAYQAWRIHRERLQQHRELFDPFVALRVRNGENISDSTQASNKAKRLAAIDTYSERLQGYDALLMPTTADMPPRLAPLQEDMDACVTANSRALRNTSLSNFIDGCAISIPCHRLGEVAAGFSLCHAHGQDARLLIAAAAAESAMCTLRD